MFRDVKTVLMVFMLSFVPQVWGQTEVCEPDPDITKDFVKLFSKCDAKKSNYCKCLESESKGNKNELFSALQKESNKDYQTLLANYKQLQVTRWMRMYSEMTVGVSLQKTLLSLDGHQGLDCHPLDVSAKFRATVSNKIKNEDGDDGKADLLDISSTSGSYEAVVDEMSDINKYSRLQKIKEFYTHVEKNSDKALEIEVLMAQVRSSQNLTLSQKSSDEIKRKRDEAILIFDNYIYEKGGEDPSFVKFGRIRDFGECRFMDDNFDMSHDKLCSELVNTKYTATDQYERNLEKKASNQCFSYADFLVYKGMPGDSILAALEGGRFDIRSVQSNKELEAQRLAFLKANPVLTQMMDNPALRKELLKGLKRISEVNRNKSERDKLNAYLNYMKNDVSKIIDTDSSLVAQVVNCDDMTNGLVAISVADDIPDAYGGKFSDEPVPVNGISDLKNNMLMCQQKDANSNLEATLNIVTAYAVTPKTFEDYENEEQLKTREYEGFLAQNCEGFDDYLKKCGDTEDCRKKYMTSNTKSVSSGNIANPLPPEEVIKKVKKQTQSTPEQIKLKNDIRSQLPKSSLPVVATRGKEKQFNDQRIANEEKISKIDVPRSKTQSVKQAQHNVPQQSPQGKEIVPVKEVQASNKLLPVLTPTSPVQNKISENTEVLKSPASIEKSAKKGESLVQKQPINKLRDPKQKISQTPPSMPTPGFSTFTPEKAVQNVVLSPRVIPDPKVVAALPKQPKENLMNTALVKMYEKSEVRALPGKVNSKEFNGVQVSEIDLVIKDEKTFEKIISNPEDLEAYIKLQFIGKSIPASSIITIINPKNGVPLAFRVRMTADGSFEIQSLPSEVKVVRKSTLKDLKLNLNSVQGLR